MKGIDQSWQSTFFQNNIPVSSWRERLQCGWRKSQTNWFVDIRSITRWIHKPKYYCIFIIISMGACFLLGSSRVWVVDLQNSFHGHSRKVCGFQRGITTSKHFVWWFHISLVVMQSQGTYNTFFFGPLSYITICWPLWKLQNKYFNIAIFHWTFELKNYLGVIALPLTR